MLHAFTFDKSTQKHLPQTKVKLIDLTDNSIDSSFNNTANDFHFVIKKVILTRQQQKKMDIIK